MSLTPERTGPSLTRSRVAQGQVTLISSNGILLRMSAAHISQQGRASQGVRVMDIRDGDTVASVAVIRETRQAVTDAEMNGAADGSETEIAPSANGGLGQETGDGCNRLVLSILIRTNSFVLKQRGRLISWPLVGESGTPKPDSRLKEKKKRFLPFDDYSTTES